MEPFAPQSWEMPPGARVLEESASVVAREFDGERLNWKVALVQIPNDSGAYMWVRPLDERFDSGFMPFGPTLHHIERVPARLGSAVLRKMFEDASDSHLARYIVLNENGEMRLENDVASDGLLVAPNGLAAWDSSLIDSNHCHALTFEWNDPMSSTDFIRLSTAQVWQRLQPLLRNLESPVNVARRFALMSSQERQKFALEEARISASEAKKLLQLLLVSQELWSELPQGSVLKLRTTEIENTFWFELNSVDERVQVSAAMEADLNTFWNWFQPLKPELLNQFNLRDWMGFDLPRFHIEVSQPSSHEQLEAALRWRQWKENHEKF